MPEPSMLSLAMISFVLARFCEMSFWFSADVLLLMQLLCRYFASSCREDHSFSRASINSEGLKGL